MKEKGLQGKVCVIPVAVVAGLGIALAGAVPIGVAGAIDITSVTDTLGITVEETCTFRDTTNITYTGSALNGSEVENFNDSGVHTFYLFCNNNNGFTVSATPYDLTTTGGIQDMISYTEQYAPSGRDGLWTAEITTSTPGLSVTNPVPATGGVIVSSSTNSSASTSFTATYSVYVGTITPAGTYTGGIEYVLSSLDGTVSNSNNNDSNSGDSGQNNDGGNSNGNSNTDSTNEVADNTDSNSGSASDPNDLNPDNADFGNLNSTQNAAPLALNNTYNTYNTTNYPSGNTITPSTTSTQDTANGGSDNNTVSGDSYEKPLGVTTNTATSSKSSGIDPAPIVVTSAVLATAGIAAVVMARNNKEEE